MVDKVSYLIEKKLRLLADPLWEEMRGESLFITGGTGLFGRWFLKNLFDANYRLGTNISVTLLTRDVANFKQSFSRFSADSNFSIVEGDVCSFIFPQKQFDKVLHMATTSAHETYHGEDQLNKFHMLVNGTERVMNLAKESGAKRVLFTSSGVVYGRVPADLDQIPETYLGAPKTNSPTSALGEGKRAAEFICAYYADKYGFEYSVARCFSFVGFGIPLNLHYAVGNFIRDALYNKEIKVSGDGLPVRSYLYLGDLVVWILMLLLRSKSGNIYNVGSDQPISVIRLAKLIRDVISPEKKVFVQGNDQSIGNFQRSLYIPSIAKAKSELGTDVWTSLEESIRLTVA